MPLDNPTLHAQRKPNSHIPKTNHIPLAHIGARVGHYWLVLGIIDSFRALLTHVGVLRWVCMGFWIPMRWYLQLENSLVGDLNQRVAQRGWFRVAVEYSLNCVQPKGFEYLHFWLTSFEQGYLA